MRIRPIATAALLILLMFALAQAVFAQDGITPPDTAQHGLDWLVIALAAVPGLITTKLLDELKKLPFLADHPGEAQAIRDSLIKILAVAISMGTAWAIATLTPIAQYLDSSGLWAAFIGFAWPMAEAWFLAHKAAKGIGLKSQVMPQ